MMLAFERLLFASVWMWQQSSLGVALEKDGARGEIFCGLFIAVLLFLMDEQMNARHDILVVHVVG
jgi:hypothetical protein